MTATTTTALVGAVGGAGTTRTAVELAALLARDGRSVAVIDAAFATQGLADYLPGRLEPDLTRVLVDDTTLEDALIDFDLPSPTPGRIACCPVHAPFERIARAKTAAAAQAFEQVVADAADRFDHVLVDVPPIAANQAIAGVNAGDRTVVVTPGTTRGIDGLLRTRDVLADLDNEDDAVLATGDKVADADAVIPTVPVDVDVPACLVDDTFAQAVAEAAVVALDVEVGLDFEQPGVLDRVRAGLE